MYHREQSTLEVSPEAVRDTLGYLKDDADEPFELLMSVHGCDYFPDEPRLAVHYQLLAMQRTDRLGVRTRLGADDPHVPTVVDICPGADFQEREAIDEAGPAFGGPRDQRRGRVPEAHARPTQPR